MGADEPCRRLPGDPHRVQPDDPEELAVVGVGGAHDQGVAVDDGDAALHAGGVEVDLRGGLGGVDVDAELLAADGGRALDLLGAGAGGLAWLTSASLVVGAVAGVVALLLVGYYYILKKGVLEWT